MTKLAELPGWATSRKAALNTGLQDGDLHRGLGVQYPQSELGIDSWGQERLGQVVKGPPSSLLALELDRPGALGGHQDRGHWHPSLG